MRSILLWICVLFCGLGVVDLFEPSGLELSMGRVAYAREVPFAHDVAVCFISLIVPWMENPYQEANGSGIDNRSATDAAFADCESRFGVAFCNPNSVTVHCLDRGL